MSLRRSFVAYFLREFPAPCPAGRQASVGHSSASSASSQKTTGGEGTLAGHLSRPTHRILCKRSNTMNPTPTLEMLDPATLTVDINVRKDAALTPDFIASIKEHGVMEPVIAHRKDDGAVHV